MEIQIENHKDIIEIQMSFASSLYLLWIWISILFLDVCTFFRRFPGGIKPEMLLFNPHLTAESSDAEKYAAFVEGVVSGRIRNHHFTPQWDKMKICDFPFSIIAQVILL